MARSFTMLRPDVVVVLGLWSVLVGAAQHAPIFAQSGDPAAEQRRSERLSEMLQRAQALPAYETRNGTDVKLELYERPLFRFNDPTREFQDATAWAWGKSGRPIALVTLEKYGSMWSYELISFSSDPISVVLPDRRRWSPRPPGLQWKSIPDSPVPADAAPTRLSQIKTLARRFTASEMAGNVIGRCQLRLLPQPIHRYSDDRARLRDGALFVFAYGTNPELLLAIECRRSDRSQDAFYFGCARLTTAELSVQLDGGEVWNGTPPSPHGTLEEPYTCFTD